VQQLDQLGVVDHIDRFRHHDLGGLVVRGLRGVRGLL
jgi:hypothetical protein